MYVFIINMLNERLFLCLCNQCAETLINMFLFLNYFRYIFYDKCMNESKVILICDSCCFHTRGFLMTFTYDSCMKLGHVAFCLSCDYKIKESVC